VGKSADASEFTDTNCTTSPCVLYGLTPGVIHSYKILAETEAGEWSESSLVSGIPMSLPGALDSLVQDTPTSLLASWPLGLQLRVQLVMSLKGHLVRRTNF
jgi:hypothetical protein